eukprot:COSAG05_NODE_4418_length_1524_cov_45.566316_2_plen_87_part_01
MHEAIHEVCGTAGRYDPAVRPLVEQYQVIFRKAIAAGTGADEVWDRVPAPCDPRSCKCDRCAPRSFGSSSRLQVSVRRCDPFHAAFS